MPTSYILSRAPDVRLVQQNQFPAYSVVLDWVLLPGGALDDTQALATAVAVALGTNSLADLTDDLPDPDSDDRQGWWGNMDAPSIWGGWELGCKLWLLSRSAILPAAARQGSTERWVETYIINAIQPFVDNKIASAFTVDTLQVDTQRIDALVTLYRGPKSAVQLRYQILWRELTP